MRVHIPRIADLVIKSSLTRRIFAITGLLGSGKTECAEKDLIRFAEEKQWKTHQINRDQSSAIRILKSIATVIESNEFDKALEKYLGQFTQVDKEAWQESLDIVSSLWDGATLLVNSFAPVSGLAMAVGSKLLSSVTFQRLVERVKAQSGKKLDILENNPIEYLANALKVDLAQVESGDRILVVIDDFELLSPCFGDWFDDLVETCSAITWVFVCWGEYLPWWFPDDERRKWDLGSQKLSVEDVSRIWNARNSLSFLRQRITEKREISLPFGGSTRPADTADTIDTEHISSTDFELFLRFQGPPTFGLPIFAFGFPTAVKLKEKAKKSRKDCWKPMIDHLRNWLSFDFPQESGLMLDERLDNLKKCAVARYLDRDVVRTLIGKDDLWRWLERSALLISRLICGKERSILDYRLRCALLYDLYRHGEGTYFALHRNLSQYYEAQQKLGVPVDYEIEIWYHRLLCHSKPEEILSNVIEHLINGIYRDEGSLSPANIREAVKDIWIENPDTVFLGEWLAPIQETVKAFETQTNWRKGTFSFFSKIVNDYGALSLLSESNRRRVIWDHDQYKYHDQHQEGDVKDELTWLVHPLPLPLRADCR